MSPMSGDPADPMPEERYQSSLLLFEQAKYLLDDEIGYAESLRSARKTIGGLLVIAIGVGLFQMDLFGAEGERLLVPPAALWSIRLLLTAAVVLLAWGAYLLYSERPLKAPKPRRDSGSKPDRPGDLFEGGKSTAALAVLDIDQSHLETLQDASPIMVLRVKTILLRRAYSRLARANRRVRYRLESGKHLIFAGFLLILIAFLVYFWTMAD